MADLLRDLPFVDLYICLSAAKPSYYQIPAEGRFVMVQKDLPGSYDADVAGLRQLLLEALGTANETGVVYDKMRLRVSKAVTTRGEVWAAMRRILKQPPSVEKLGFTAPITQALRETGKRDGLILICGATGQGKTTTASSLLYDYLNRLGGVAFTIEDPVEYLMDGRHGEAGLCYQVEVKEEGDWAELLKRSLRWHPRYIMVGEVRTPEAANQLLRAATSGHLVITTMHAGVIEEGLEGLLHLAEQAIGDHAAILLAAGLTAALDQHFMTHSISSRLITTQAGNLGDPVRALIRDRHIGQITTFIDQQMARQTVALDRPAEADVHPFGRPLYQRTKAV